jgi:aminoglycoside phosphotransferase (APT) family kinase protein
VAEASAEIAAALARWLRAQGLRADVVAQGRATVGLSQETWFVEVVVDGAASRAVLRLPTQASGSGSILTQRAALQAVAGSGVPAPGVLWFDDREDNPFGRPFLVMERLPGEAPVGWHELPEPRRTTLAQAAIDALVQLHSIDIAATPLAGAKPSLTVDLEALMRLFSRLAPLPTVVRAALWWLPRHRPSGAGRKAIVHGDFRMGNLLVDGSRISGVLDWEMAAPGDPLVDLSWCFIPVFKLPEVDEPALLRRYAQGAGASFDPDAWHWHRVLSFTRLAYYALAGARSFDAGRSQDLRLAALRLQLPVTLDRLAATLAGDPVE